MDVFKFERKGFNFTATLNPDKNHGPWVQWYRGVRLMGDTPAVSCGGMKAKAAYMSPPRKDGSKPAADVFIFYIKDVRDPQLFVDQATLPENLFMVEVSDDLAQVAALKEWLLAAIAEGQQALSTAASA